MNNPMDNKNKINPDIDALILSFLDGTISHKEFLSLKEFTFANTTNREYVKKRIEVLFSSNVLSDKTSFDQEAAIQRYFQHIESTDYKRKTPVIQFTKWRFAIGIAASILIIVLPWIGYQVGTTTIKNNLAQIETTTSEASQATINLPDGTVVTLNPKSRLQYSQDYGIENRDVTIEGEADFKVNHTSGPNFRVKVGSITVIDKGTEFKVRNYREDSFISVELTKGKVMIDNSILHKLDSTIVPGERVVVNKRTGRMEKSQIKSDTVPTTLTFEDMKMEKVATILSKIYGVKIHVSNSSKGKLFNGNFDVSKNGLPQILEAMSATRQIKYKKEKGIYYIY